MSEPLTTRPDFLGKDQVSIFIGQVEDVEDPKLSGRVKVRCVGYHTSDRKGGSLPVSRSKIVICGFRYPLPVFCTNRPDKIIS